MARTGLNMKVVDEVLRLFKLGFTKRKIARSLGIHRKTVTKYLKQNLAEKPFAVDTGEPPVVVARGLWQCSQLAEGSGRPAGGRAA
jgi:hypothetical protein